MAAYSKEQKVEKRSNGKDRERKAGGGRREVEGRGLIARKPSSTQCFSLL